MCVEVGCPPVSAAAACTGRAPAALLQVGLLADKLTLAATSHVIPHTSRGHRHTILKVTKVTQYSSLTSPYLVAVSPPVVGVVLPPVGVAPGGAVAPLEGVLGPDVVGPDPGVLGLPGGAVDQGVLLRRGDGHQLPGVRAGAGQAGRLPGGLGE